MRLQHRIGEEEPGRFHVGHEQRALIAGGDVASEHHADFVGKDRLALIVDHAAPVAVAIEGQTEIGLVFQHGVACRVQHAEIFGIRIMRREGVVELAVERDDGGAKLGENARGEGAPRAVAAGDDDLQGAQQFGPRQEIGHVALRHVRYEDVAATLVLRGELRVEDDLLERGHVVGREGEGPLDAHLDAGPAIVVMAGGDHGNAFDLKGELREIGHGRERQADIMQLGAAGKQSHCERGFHRGRIGAEVVADHDARGHAARAHQCGKAESDGLEPEQVDLLGVAPARVIFAKSGRLDEGQALEFGGIGNEILARLWKHAPS